MPRALVVGNGSVLATFDTRLQLRDLYYPYVGMEDHTAYGDVHRTGVFLEGKGMRWFDHPSWKIDVRYRPESLVGDSILRNEELGIEIEAQDYVHPVKNILIRHFLIRSIDGKDKEIQCFFNHDLHIYGDKQKDTAFYEPFTNSVIHFRQKRYFLIGGQTSRPVMCITGKPSKEYESILHSKENIESCGISSYSIGKADYRGLEGTWRDAEDGNLSNTTVDQGSVDSTVGIRCLVSPTQQTEVTLWMCLGKTLDEVVSEQQFVLKEGQERMQRNCHNYWKSWVNKTQRDFRSLPQGTAELYKRSLHMIRLHADNGGGIIAAADADIMEFNRDTYTYVWPRDGAFVSMALDRAGYHEVPCRFFDFCVSCQSQDGYMLHKYNPDGSMGSTWHPWFRDGHAQLPIQEDETALVVLAIWRHFERTQDFEFLQNMYERFVKRAGKFLKEFREKSSNLPLPSYDPWEEHRAVSTYTTACTVAGLHAAASISQILGHYNHFELYEMSADETKQAMLYHLFDEGEKSFVKSIHRSNGQTTARDLTPDMSIAAIWKTGVLPADDPRVVSTMKRLYEKLLVRTPIGGLARYKTDFYHAKEHPSDDVPGNPWFITTLWYAQWIIATAKNTNDLKRAYPLIEWVIKNATPTGMLAEQVHPRTGAPLSVAPLTWSHATFLETVLMYQEKEASFT